MWRAVTLDRGGSEPPAPQWAVIRRPQGPGPRFYAASIFAAVLAWPDALSAQQPTRMPAMAHGSSAEAVVLFPTREASGTAWVPDDTPMTGSHWRAGQWEIMVHGVVFGQLAIEPGEVHRTGGVSSHQVSSVNWGMLMARRELGAGRLGVKTMLSAETWTVTDCGFIDYFATGEMCAGERSTPLVAGAAAREQPRRSSAEHLVRAAGVRRQTGSRPSRRRGGQRGPADVENSGRVRARLDEPGANYRGGRGNGRGQPRPRGAVRSIQRPVGAELRRVPGAQTSAPYVGSGSAVR